VNVCICSNIILSITVLLLIRTCDLNVIALDFSEDISIPNCSLLLCKVHNAVWKSSSESDRSTWWSANKSVLSTVTSFQFCLSIYDSSEWSFHSCTCQRVFFSHSLFKIIYTYALPVILYVCESCYTP